MLLTITTTHRPATDLGYLLHKNPGRVQSFELMWESLPAGRLPHRDHRFEWTRAEYQSWATRIAARFGYTVRFLPIGPENALVGAPTQMTIFCRVMTDGKCAV